MALSLQHQDTEAKLGASSHLKLSRERRFAELIFELLSERQPTAEELRVFELILNLSIDHGPDTPSAKATIAAARVGKTMGESIAAGVQEINDVHGGAQEVLMPLLFKIVKENITPETIVAELVAKQARLPGFGHRLYTQTDPRAELILQTLQESNLGRDYIIAARGLGEELTKQTSKILPLNIDGAIAVALCTFAWPAVLGKAVFIIARTPGLCGQYLNSKV